MSDGKIRLSYISNPIGLDRLEKFIDPGQTIQEIIEDLGCFENKNLIVFLDGNPVPPEQRSLIKPKPGYSLNIRAIPTGGGGGKRVLNIVGGIAGIAIGGLGALGAITAIGRLAFGAIAGLGFSLVRRGLTPPPPQRLSAISQSGFVTPSVTTPELFTPGAIRTNPTERDPLVPSISGSQNQANPYGVIPRVYGKYRMYPPLGAQPVTSLVGNTQYVTILLCLGFGPVDVTNIKIGNNLIAASPTAGAVQTVTDSPITGVQYELRQGYPADTALTLYPNDINEEGFSLPLTNAGGYVIRAASQPAEELSVDISFDQGLTLLSSDGSKSPRTVAVTVEYRLAGSADPWVSAGTITTTDNSTSVVRGGLNWLVTLGTYEIRLRRTTADSSDINVLDKVWWTTLRAIRRVDPIQTLKDQAGNTIGIAKLALRIQATDQLSGVPDQISCEVESRLKVYSGGNWNTEAATRNPAWIFADILSGTANARAESRTKLDEVSLAAWATACTSAGRECNFIVDSTSTVFETARQVAAIGRAAWSEAAGKYGVVLDTAQSTPIQHFTPRNSWGFSANRTFHDQPHAFRCMFINPDANWQQDEVIVYDDGYNADGSGGLTAATKFETLQLPGVTNSSQAYKEGRYHIAVGRLRPWIYEFYTDIENLACTRGDLIKVSHDVLEWGLSQGRVKTVVLDGGSNCTGITTDELCTMAEGNTYGIRIRKSDGTSLINQVIRVVGEQTTLTFLTPILNGNPMPVAGDLFQFGIFGSEAVDLLVKQIEYGPDGSGKITAVDYSGAVYTADTGTIPAFSSQMTRPPSAIQQIIAKPVILNVRSDEQVLLRAPDGSLESRIAISLGQPDTTVEYWQVQYKRSDSTGLYTQLPAILATTSEISVVPVEDGVEYQVRIRAVNRVGLVSDWTILPLHTVIGKTTPPPDVSGVSITGNKLGWSYADAIKPPDFAGFYVRHNAGSNTNFAQAIPAHDGILTANSFDITGLPGGTRTIMVVAVDTSGNFSATPAFIVKDLGDALTDNIVESYDYKAASFPGTVTNGTLSGGNLVADTLTPFWSGVDSTPFWSGTDSAPFWTTAEYLQMTYESSTFTPSPAQLPARMSLLFTVAAATWTLEYRTVSDSPFWGDDGSTFWGADGSTFWASSEVYGDWLPWPGYLDIPAGNTYGYQFRIVTSPGVTQGVISRLIVQLDVEDVSEGLSDINISASGTRLPFTQTYRVIKTVNITLKDDGGTARTGRWIDKDAILGPLIKLFDSSNVAVSGTIDALIQGY